MNIIERCNATGLPEYKKDLFELLLFASRFTDNFLNILDGSTVEHKLINSNSNIFIANKV